MQSCGLSENSFYEPLHPGFPNVEQVNEENSVMELNINESDLSDNDSPMELEVLHSPESIIEL